MADQEITSTTSNNSDHRSELERGGPTTAFSETPDVHGTGAKIERARSAYKAYLGIENNKPKKLEVFGWCFYGLCSYFIYTVLIPVVFPLIISQISTPWPDNNYADLPPAEVVVRGGRSLLCNQKQLILYERVTDQAIKVSGTKFSPLEWTSISWAVGLTIAAPTLALLSVPLDRGPHQSLIALAAAVAGAASCLPAGLFRTVWIFPLYIAAVSAAAAITSAHHTRHLSLMLRSFTSATPALNRRRFPLRRAASSWLSLAAAASGSLGSAVIAAFSYQMLRGRSEPLLSLWIVSIFSGLKWLLGSFHFAISSNRSQTLTTVESKLRHPFSILAYPHAMGGLVSGFLSSLATMTIFAGAVLYLAGELCLNPKSLLYLSLAYFMFPFVSLPLFHPVQQLLRANAVKMKLLGLFVTAAVSGIGFTARSAEWNRTAAVAVAAVQGTAAGLLHAFGRVLLLDCAPRGKEGAFAAWLVWARAAGSCVGFAVASAAPGNAGVAFGLGFFSAVVASVVLIFGNVSDFGGAVAAGIVRGEEECLEERGSPVNGVDNDAAYSGRVQVKQETP